MALLAGLLLALALIAAGILLAFTDVLFLEAFGGLLAVIGWLLLLFGIAIAIALLVKYYLFEDREARRTRRERRLT